MVWLSGQMEGESHKHNLGGLISMVPAEGEGSENVGIGIDGSYLGTTSSGSRRLRQIEVQCDKCHHNVAPRPKR